MFKNAAQNMLSKFFPNVDELMSLQSQLQKMEFTGRSKNGLVSVVLKGTLELSDVKINEEVFSQYSFTAKDLEKSFKEAYKEAVKAIQKHMVGILRGKLGR